MNDVLFVILALVVIILLIYLEYKSHDCIPGKTCSHSVILPSLADDNLVYIDKLKSMVRNSSDFVIWRQALLVGLVVAIPIIYFLKRRLPTIVEWLVVGTLVFIGTYFSASWLHAHFTIPNTTHIEDSLLHLRDRLQS